MLRYAMEPTLLLVFAFVLIVVIAQNRAREKREKLRILEEALRSGNLDEATRQELVGELTGRSRDRREEQRLRERVERRGSSVWSKLLFALGWVALFLGVGLMVIDQPDTFEAGVLVGVGGFAAMSLPLAIREFDRDRAKRNA